jgi:hypothetical protein
MKVLLSCLILLVLIGCSKSEVKPEKKDCMGSWSKCEGSCGIWGAKQTFVVSQPASNGGMACEAADGAFKVCTASLCPAVDPLAEYCKPEGKHFNCGNPVWYGLPGCKPDSDGDGGAEGIAYFASLKEIEAMATKQNVSVRIKMKDNSVVQYGVGFAAPCSEM